MRQSAWRDKRERQYEHIKEGQLERGSGEDKAEEIAARTVNRERARQSGTATLGAPAPLLTDLAGDLPAISA